MTEVAAAQQHRWTINLAEIGFVALSVHLTRGRELVGVKLRSAIDRDVDPLERVGSRG